MVRTGRPSAWRKALPLAGLLGVLIIGGVIVFTIYTPRRSFRMEEIGVQYDASGRKVEAGLIETISASRFWLARFVYALFLLVAGCALLIVQGVTVAIRRRLRLTQNRERTGRQALYGGILIAVLGPLLLCGASALSIEFFQWLRGVYPRLP